MTLLRLAWLNLTRHRASTGLALLALGVTVACAGLMLRTAKLAEARFGTMVIAGDALVAAKGGSLDAVLGALNLEGPYPRFIPLRLFVTLTNERWYEAGNESHASSIVPLVFAGKYFGERRAGDSRAGGGREGYRVVGTTAGILTMPAPSPAMVLDFGIWPAQEQGVVIGAEVARREGLTIGDTIAIASWTADTMPAILADNPGPPPRAFRVEGVLSPMGNAWDRLLLTNLVQSEALIARGLAVAGERTAWETFVLHYILTHAEPGGLEAMSAMIHQQTVSQIVPVRETLASLERVTGAGRTLGLAVALLALFLAAATLAALMLGRFESLARQAAVLEAMGWRKSTLRGLLAWEGLFLGVGAVLVGALLDAALFPVLRSFLSTALPGPDIVASVVWESAPVWAAALVITVGASLASSLLLFRGRAQERLRGLG